MVFGHNLFVFIGPHRNRTSNIESWNKTPLISTRLGKIIGLEKATSDGEVMAFLGIRYGEPPVGKMRFMPAKPVNKWNGIFQATRFPSAAIQPKADKSTIEPNIPQQSEDCLFLSVYTPSLEGVNRPVLFWIHGGAFTFGSGNGYPGHELAKQGNVVVVSINYRLGLLGFCDLSMFGDEYAGSASIGIQDQILALQWVRKNIADYGGDPDNITIFGQSAGGSSVSSLICSPKADGLFHKAILHSGMEVAFPPHDYTQALQKHLKVSHKNDIPNSLKELPVDEILTVQKKIGFFSGGNIDGVIVTRSIKDAIFQHGKAGVPIIVGSNKNEGALFSLIAPRITYQHVIPAIAALTTQDNDTEGYINELKRDNPKISLKQLHDLIWTEAFQCSAYYMAEWASKAGRKVWMYRFEEPVQMNPFGYKLCSCHAAEMEFTFNNFARDDLGNSSLWYDKRDPEIIHLAKIWSNTVIAFATTGDPNGTGLPLWQQYEPNNPRYMVLKRHSEVKLFLDKEVATRWAKFRK